MAVESNTPKPGVSQAETSKYERGRWVEKSEVISIPEARQGVTGQNVRSVLMFGTLGVIIAFAIVYFFFIH